MEVRDKGKRGDRFDNSISGCFIIITKQQLFNTHYKINQIFRECFILSEVKYEPKDILYKKILYKLRANHALLLLLMVIIPHTSS